MSWARAKLWSALSMVFLLLVFTVQNTEIVEVQFLFWSVGMSRAILLLGVFAAGLALGWIVSGLRHGHREAKQKK